MQDSGTDKVREMIEWARERGVLLHSVKIGDCEVVLYDPGASAAALAAPGPADDDEDRDEDGQPVRLPNAYVAYAKQMNVRPGR